MSTAQLDLFAPKAPPVSAGDLDGLIVVCTDEADQRKKFEQLKKRGLAVRVVTV